MVSLPTFAVARRYRRSIQLDRDFTERQAGLDGYQLTPLVLACLEQVIAGLQHTASVRAFSVIGPYGSGKSAFGLFLAHYLASVPTERVVLLDRHGSPAPASAAIIDAPPLLPILVGGNNTSLRHMILRTLAGALSSANIPDPEELLTRITMALDDPDLDPQYVALLVEDASRLVANGSAFAGIALLIDELGQYLDYTVREGDERDLFVLQTLAEMSARSGPAPCLLLTILHQSFDRYAGRLGVARRTEWAKVQGRFVDLPFQEPASQMIRMVGRALQSEQDDLYVTERLAWVAHMSPLTETLNLRPPDINRDEWAALLGQTYPIHPLVLVALPYLFRQLAQNERSLFAFLASHEPWALQDVVNQERDSDRPLPIYRLPHLYAYIDSALGSSLFHQARGRRWSELAETLVRAPDLDPDTQAALIAIGTMNALGQIRSFRASSAHISFALRDMLEAEDILSTLEQLRVHGLIIYRHHRDSFLLYEGSDLDIDALVQTASRNLADKLDIPALLTTYASVVPLVARRFSYQTGAIRHFGVRFVGVDSLHILPDGMGEHDGEILYIVPEHEESLGQAQAWVAAPERQAETARISVLPHQIHVLRDMLLEAAALTTVLAEEPQLEHDRVAKREVASRLAEIEQDLSASITQTYRPDASAWWWRGERIRLHTTHDLDQLLSHACETTFPSALWIWNELIMRQNLSSAAAKARRNLIQAMLDYAHLPHLGLEGFPPERAIYETVLSSTGLHRHDPQRGWHIGAPGAVDPARLQPTWQAIDDFLETTLQGPRDVEELYAVIEAPPYGVKAGLTPLLFMAAYLARAGEMSLYEHGSYVAIPDITVFERMLRQPEKFMVRLSQIRGARSVIYERLARAMAPQLLTNQRPPSLVDAVLPLLRVAYELSDYAKYTDQISAHARAIRRALLEAPAPDTLLFEALPLACGIAPFPADYAPDVSATDQFFSLLQKGLNELQGAYPALQTWMLEQLQCAFDAPSAESDALRENLTQRYRYIAGATSDSLLRAFGVRLETANSGIGWVETVGALLGKKSMRQWRDSDREAVQLYVADLGRRFQEVEQLTTAVGAMPAEANVRRIGLIDETGERSVIVHANAWTPEMKSLRQQLKAVVKAYPALTSEQRLMVVADLLGLLIAKNTKETTS